MLKKKRIVSGEYRNRRVGDFLKELQLTEDRATGFIYSAFRYQKLKLFAQLSQFQKHKNYPVRKAYIASVRPKGPEIYFIR